MHDFVQIEQKVTRETVFKRKAVNLQKNEDETRYKFLFGIVVVIFFFSASRENGVKEKKLECFDMKVEKKNSTIELQKLRNKASEGNRHNKSARARERGRDR